MKHINPNDAFNYAIEKGLLTVNEKDSNFAGNYMYMHTDSNGHNFKNINTRKYISIK